MTSAEDLAAVVEAEALANRFYRHLDLFEYEALVDLMAPDGVWIRRGLAMRAGPEVLKVMRERSTTQTIVHLLTNMHSEVTGAGSVTVRAYMMAFNHDDGTRRTEPAPLGGPALIAPIVFETRRTDLGWRIAKVDYNYLFKS